MRKIIHIDMDCFYAAIEMRDNPDLNDKPIAVGGAPNTRGVLCTSNYIARKQGVRSAMSSAKAKMICPDLIILPVDMPKYRAASQEIRQIFFEYTNLVEPLSLDEAYLDVTHSNQCQNSATRMAEEIRQKIFVKCQLTASAGIAPNKFLAKVASVINKPNGQYVITPQAVPEFVKTLSVKKIFGVGKVTAEKLAKFGITNCLDVQARTCDELTQHFGKFGTRLYDFSRGIDHRPVEPSLLSKSLSVENTFPQDLLTLEACLQELPNLHQNLLKRLAHKSERILHKQFVKVKFRDFKSTTVEMISSNLSLEIFQQLIKTGYNRRSLPVRLLGVGVGFKDAEETVQGTLSL